MLAESNMRRLNIRKSAALCISISAVSCVFCMCILLSLCERRREPRDAKQNASYGEYDGVEKTHRDGDDKILDERVAGVDYNEVLQNDPDVDHNILNQLDPDEDYDMDDKHVPDTVYIKVNQRLPPVVYNEVEKNIPDMNYYEVDESIPDKDHNEADQNNTNVDYSDGT